jgi:hypothetical protein
VLQAHGERHRFLTEDFGHLRVQRGKLRLSQCDRQRGFPGVE